MLGGMRRSVCARSPAWYINIIGKNIKDGKVIINVKLENRIIYIYRDLV